ncbi:MAG: hypothetical protein QM677_10610 [Microbacterium sp.]
MPVLLTDRAATSSPTPLVTLTDARMLGLRIGGPGYRRVRPRVYADRAQYDALPAWRRYEARVHAFLLRRPGAILCLESAAVVHGLPLFGETRDIHVYDRDRSRTKRFGDVVVHASIDEREVVSRGGIHVTTLLDTVVDLARVLPPARALAVADAAVSPAQGGPLPPAAFAARADAQQNTRGRGRSRWVWDRVDPRAESAGESISRAGIEWGGFERPEPQVVLRYEGHVDRVDFGFPRCRGLGESDGWGKYGMTDPAAAERHLTAQKRREDRLRRHGHPLARWEFRDAWRVLPMCEKLHAAGIPSIRPVQPALIATMRDQTRTLPR